MCIGYQTGSQEAAMLILTRYRGQSIRIGDGVTVKVLKVRRGYVLVGIEAPEGVRVMRCELPGRGPTQARRR
jgi:carbon storage regulator